MYVKLKHLTATMHALAYAEQLLFMCTELQTAQLSKLWHILRSEDNWHRWQGISRILEGRGAKPAVADMPKGLYMYGGVGVGKTMLMDLLVKAAPSQFQACETLPLLLTLLSLNTCTATCVSGELA